MTLQVNDVRRKLESRRSVVVWASSDERQGKRAVREAADDLVDPTGDAARDERIRPLENQGDVSDGSRGLPRPFHPRRGMAVMGDLHPIDLVVADP